MNGKVLPFVSREPIIPREERIQCHRTVRPFKDEYEARDLLCEVAGAMGYYGIARSVSTLYCMKNPVNLYDHLEVTVKRDPKYFFEHVMTLWLPRETLEYVAMELPWHTKRFKKGAVGQYFKNLDWWMRKP